MLDELRQFRHVVKAIYPSLIRPDDVRRNLEVLLKVAPGFTKEFKAFTKRVSTVG